MGADLDPRFRPPACCAPAIRAKCGEWLPVIREAARGAGYAIGVHGSLERDLDIIAAPWTDEPAEPKTLVVSIVEALRKHVGDDGVYWKAEEHWTARPHGRVSLTIVFQCRHLVETPNGAFPFIDLSIMPLVA